jgi:large subunit ribosomal protein L15e
MHHMFSKHMRSLWKAPSERLGPEWKALLIGLRKEPVMARLDKPTRLDRARGLGYKAKKGHVVVRIRISKGMRKTPKKGRRSPTASGRFFTPGLSLKARAEQRVARKYKNLEVLNSYEVAQDGQRKWFEILMVDTGRPEVSKDPERKWLAGKSQRGRAFRGKTSAGKRSRGHVKRGKGSEKTRPSLKAKSGRGK